MVCLKGGSDCFGVFLIPWSKSFSCCYLTTFLSYPLMPISENVSAISIVLTYLSNTLEELKEGILLTSRTHGFIFSSNIISNPNTSKQHFYLLPALFISLTTWTSAEIKVLMITSWQESNKSSSFLNLYPSSDNFFLKYLFKNLRLHFDEDSYSGSSSITISSSAIAALPFEEFLLLLTTKFFKFFLLKLNTDKFHRLETKPIS